MVWGIGEPIVRLWAILFGIAFSSVAIAVAAVGVHDSDPIAVAVGAGLLAGGLWIIAIGIVGVPMRSGAFVGGGPALRRIGLESDEQVLDHCWGACQPARARLSALSMFFTRGQGEVFVTDRRIIVADWRLQSADPPVALPLRDIVEARESQRTTLAALGAPSLDVVTRTGLTYVFWFRNPAVATELREMLAKPPPPSEVSAEAVRPARRTVTTRILGGLARFLLFTALAFGRTSPPYVGGPTPFLFVWLIYASVSTYQVLDFIRETRRRRLL